MIFGTLESRAVKLEIVGWVAVCGGVYQRRGGGQETNMRLMAHERRRGDSRSSPRYGISRGRVMYQPCVAGYLQDKVSQ